MLKSYISLTKPRICILVLVTTYLGYYIGLRNINMYMTTLDEWLVFSHLVLGTLLSCAGACALNQAIEYKSDRKMKRTSNRAIPSGIISQKNGLLFGTILSMVLILVLLIFKDMIFSLYGDEYIVETSVLMLLLIGHFVGVISGSVGRTLTLSGNGWVHCTNSIIAIILSLIMAIFLIPQNFIIGAAISTSLAIIIKNLLGVFYVHRLFGFISLPNRQAFSNLKIQRINEILSHRN